MFCSVFIYVSGFLSLFSGAATTNCDVSLKSLSRNAYLQILIDLLNTSMFHEVSVIRFSMDLASCFNIFGGWLEYLLICNILLLGLRYGL